MVRKRGMTLIELLISLSIIAMMTGVAIPLFSSSQNRNSINSDAQAVAQMFSYAAALQNNPDSFSRNHPNPDPYLIDGRVTLKILTATPSISEKITTVMIYSTSSPGIIYDRLILGSREDIKLNGSLLADDQEFVVDFSGKSPSEKITCSILRSGVPSALDCSTSLNILVTSTRDSEISRNVSITNTNPANFKYFSVAVSPITP